MPPMGMMILRASLCAEKSLEGLLVNAWDCPFVSAFAERNCCGIAGVELDLALILADFRVRVGKSMESLNEYLNRL